MLVLPSLENASYLYDSALALYFTDVGYLDNRLQGTSLDISSDRFFKAIGVCDSTGTKKCQLLKI